MRSSASAICSIKEELETIMKDFFSLGPPFPALQKPLGGLPQLLFAKVPDNQIVLTDSLKGCRPEMKIELFLFLR
jgi:hypothetical protein